MQYFLLKFHQVHKCKHGKNKETTQSSSIMSREGEDLIHPFYMYHSPHVNF